MKSNKNNDKTDVNDQVKAKILPLVNGPYYLINDMEPKIVKINHFVMEHTEQSDFQV